MKSPAPWLEFSLLAAGLMIVTIAVMWVQRPDGGCTMSFEPPRHLVLSRETDREHLATDLASADRIARRYMRSTTNPADQHTRFVACEATLVLQIGVVHGLPPDHVRAGPTDAP